MQPGFLHRPTELMVPEEKHSDLTSSLNARPGLRHHLSNPMLRRKFSFLLPTKPSERDRGGIYVNPDSDESHHEEFMAETSFHSERNMKSTRNSRTSSWRRSVWSRGAPVDVDYGKDIHSGNRLVNDGNVSRSFRPNAPRSPLKKSRSLLDFRAKSTSQLDNTFSDYAPPPCQSLSKSSFQTRVANLFTARIAPKLPVPVPSIVITPTLESVDDGSSYSGDLYSRLELESSCSEGQMSPRSSTYEESGVTEVSEDEMSMWWW
ncbi:hypothetical protein PM082_023582 [Marasmius tenuissimus]|nr:hypothetical protein PM082_023588 [Marasmius tenuissimus]KAJ8092946.1 hypothetical protein PM082_023582 [Marasmius tenuissimus]